MAISSEQIKKDIVDELYRDLRTQLDSVSSYWRFSQAVRSN